MKQSIFHSHLSISATRGETSQNSSVLDMGRRPKLKSEEFSEVPPLVIEIPRCEDTEPSQKWYTFWERHPQALSTMDRDLSAASERIVWIAQRHGWTADRVESTTSRRERTRKVRKSRKSMKPLGTWTVDPGR